MARIFAVYFKSGLAGCSNGFRRVSIETLQSRTGEQTRSEQLNSFPLCLIRVDPRHPCSISACIVRVFLLALTLIVSGCAVYTFSGSTLPGYLKTVDIPLFVNESLQPGVAEDITTALNQRVQTANLLRVVSNNGDATIAGTVHAYVNYPRTYSRETTREVDVTEYAVRITVDVSFMDNKKNEPLYKGTIVGEGIYNFKTQTEDVGRAAAIKDVIDQVLQSSIQSW